MDKRYGVSVGPNMELFTGDIVVITIEEMNPIDGSNVFNVWAQGDNGDIICLDPTIAIGRRFDQQYANQFASQQSTQTTQSIFNGLGYDSPLYSGNWTPSLVNMFIVNVIDGRLGIFTLSPVVTFPESPRYITPQPAFIRSGVASSLTKTAWTTQIPQTLTVNTYLQPNFGFYGLPAAGYQIYPSRIVTTGRTINSGPYGQQQQETIAIPSDYDLDSINKMFIRGSANHGFCTCSQGKVQCPFNGNVGGTIIFPNLSNIDPIFSRFVFTKVPQPVGRRLLENYRSIIQHKSPNTFNLYSLFPFMDRVASLHFHGAESSLTARRLYLGQIRVTTRGTKLEQQAIIVFRNLVSDTIRFTFNWGFSVIPVISLGTTPGIEIIPGFPFSMKGNQREMITFLDGGKSGGNGGNGGNGEENLQNMAISNQKDDGIYPVYDILTKTMDGHAIKTLNDEYLDFDLEKMVFENNPFGVLEKSVKKNEKSGEKNNSFDSNMTEVRTIPINIPSDNNLDDHLPESGLHNQIFYGYEFQADGKDFLKKKQNSNQNNLHNNNSQSGNKKSKNIRVVTNLFKYNNDNDNDIDDSYNIVNSKNKKGENNDQNENKKKKKNNTKKDDTKHTEIDDVDRVKTKERIMSALGYTRETLNGNNTLSKQQQKAIDDLLEEFSKKIETNDKNNQNENQNNNFEDKNRQRNDEKNQKRFGQYDWFKDRDGYSGLLNELGIEKQQNQIKTRSNDEENNAVFSNPNSQNGKNGKNEKNEKNKHKTKNIDKNDKKLQFPVVSVETTTSQPRLEFYYPISPDSSYYSHTNDHNSPVTQNKPNLTNIPQKSIHTMGISPKTPRNGSNPLHLSEQLSILIQKLEKIATKSFHKIETKNNFSFQSFQSFQNIPTFLQIISFLFGLDGNIPASNQHISSYLPDITILQNEYTGFVIKEGIFDKIKSHHSNNQNDKANLPSNVGKDNSPQLDEENAALTYSTGLHKDPCSKLHRISINNGGTYGIDRNYSNNNAERDGKNEKNGIRADDSNFDIFYMEWLGQCQVSHQEQLDSFISCVNTSVRDDYYTCIKEQEEMLEKSVKIISELITRNNFGIKNLFFQFYFNLDEKNTFNQNNNFSFHLSHIISFILQQYQSNSPNFQRQLHNILNGNDFDTNNHSYTNPIQLSTFSERTNSNQRNTNNQNDRKFEKFNEFGNNNVEHSIDTKINHQNYQHSFNAFSSKFMGSHGLNIDNRNFQNSHTVAKTFTTRNNPQNEKSDKNNNNKSQDSENVNNNSFISMLKSYLPDILTSTDFTIRDGLKANINLREDNTDFEIQNTTVRQNDPKNDKKIQHNFPSNSLQTTPSALGDPDSIIDLRHLVSQNTKDSVQSSTGKFLTNNVDDFDAVKNSANSQNLNINILDYLDDDLKKLSKNPTKNFFKNLKPTNGLSLVQNELKRHNDQFRHTNDDNIDLITNHPPQPKLSSLSPSFFFSTLSNLSSSNLSNQSSANFSFPSLSKPNNPTGDNSPQKKQHTHTFNPLSTNPTPSSEPFTPFGSSNLHKMSTMQIIPGFFDGVVFNFELDLAFGIDADFGTVVEMAGECALVSPPSSASIGHVVQHIGFSSVPFTLDLVRIEWYWLSLWVADTHLSIQPVDVIPLLQPMESSMMVMGDIGRGDGQNHKNTTIDDEDVNIIKEKSTAGTTKSNIDNPIRPQTISTKWSAQNNNNLSLANSISMSTITTPLPPPPLPTSPSHHSFTPFQTSIGTGTNANGDTQTGPELTLADPQQPPRRPGPFSDLTDAITDQQQSGGGRDDTGVLVPGSGSGSGSGSGNGSTGSNGENCLDPFLFDNLADRFTIQKASINRNIHDFTNPLGLEHPAMELHHFAMSGTYTSTSTFSLEFIIERVE
jgi:hypothetical protein